MEYFLRANAKEVGSFSFSSQLAANENFEGKCLHLPDWAGIEYFCAKMSGGHDFVKSSISVSVLHECKKVKFGPKGNIIMDLKGVGFGSVLMFIVIGWLKRSGYGHYKVEEGVLSGEDARTEEERNGRNWFYIKHGFSLAGDDGASGLNVVNGSFYIDSVSLLKSSLRVGTNLKNLRLDSWSFD